MDLLVISSYPEKGSTHGVGTVGVASYTKNTLLAMVKAAMREKEKLRIVVLAERLNNEERSLDFARDDNYKEDGIEVRRVWKRNSVFLFWNLLKEIIRERETLKVMIAFEHAMFGNYLLLVFLPLFLLILKILKKDIYIVMHQVIDDINDLSGHIGLEYGNAKGDLINLVIGVFYRSVFVLVNKIVVFEEIFKEKLAEFTDKKKILVIPHGVEDISVKDVKKPTDEFVILYFGFIAWYKGTDWIIDRIQNSEFRIQNAKIKLIIAGGANPNHRNKKFYIDYINKVKDTAKLSNGQIVMTGFVEEKDIVSYFQSCDLVVLPYRTMMSSSGPLSLALSFGKPFLISENMEEICDTSDFKDTLRETELKIEDFTFSLTDDSFERKLKVSDFLKLTKFSETLREKRRFEKIGRRFLEL